MGNDLVSQKTSGALAKVSSGNLPAPISSGILDLLTVFSAQHQEEADKKRVWRVYAEAVAGADPAIAEYALRWLKLHNPRNPWRPTPQDVYEMCGKVRNAWRERVVKYFTEPSARKWGSGFGVLEEKFDWGPAPLEAQCLIPETVVKSFLCEWLGSLPARSPLLENMGRAGLARIPSDCFADGQLDAAVAAILETERKSAEKKKFDAYLETLDPDLRNHRRLVMNRGENYKLSEDELLVLAQKSMDQTAQETAERKREAENARVRSMIHLLPDVAEALESLRQTTRAEPEIRHKALSRYIELLEAHDGSAPAHILVEWATKK